MSTSHHVLDLIKSHVAGNEQQFYSAALQIAAHEARQENNELAQEIKKLIDQAKVSKSVIEKSTDSIQLKGDLANLALVESPNTRLSDMILHSDVEVKLNRVLTEQRQENRLREHGLTPRRKLLMIGSSGTGKTMTAEALASELKLPLITVLYDSLMGTTEKTINRLKLVFEAMTKTKGVYCFDGFNIEKHQQVLDVFTIFLRQDKSSSLVILLTCPSSQSQLQNTSLFNYFDDVIKYDRPDETMRHELIKSRLISFDIDWEDWTKITEEAKGLRHNDIIIATDEAVKQAVLLNNSKVREEDLITAIVARRHLFK